MTPADSPAHPSGTGRTHRGFQPEHRLLLVTAVVSLVAHVVVMAATGHLPLGRVDPALLAEQNQLMSVQRVSDESDRIVEDATPDEQSNDQQSELGSLARTLLAEQDPPPSAVDPDAAPGPDLPQVKDGEQLSRLIKRMAATVPEVNLPRTPLGRTGAEIEVEVRYASASGAGGARGNGAGVDMVVRGEAQRLLESGKHAPLEPSPAPEPAAGPSIIDRAEPRRPAGILDAPLRRPKVDFLEIAKLDSAQLRLPQHLDHDFDYKLTRFRPSSRRGLFGRTKKEDDKRGYFRLEITPKRSLRKLTSMPKDVVFLIDTSGSVSQAWVDQIVRGVASALNRLNKGDRFNIVFFDEDTVIFSPDSIRPFNSRSLAEAQRFLEHRKSKGYTDVNRALSRLVVRDLAVERVYDLVMISDGKPTRGLMDTRKLINMVTRDFGLTASIYCVGIGQGQNRELLEFLAYRNKGMCVFVKRPQDAANTIDELASRLRFPIIKDVRMSIVGTDADEVFPRDLSNVHQAEVFSIYGRYDDEKPFTVRITGMNGKAPVDFTLRQDLANAQTADEGIDRDWAFWKLHHLYSLMIHEGETKELKQAIDVLRRKYKLKTLYQ